MLVLRTGLPGHSKTLNSIKEIDAEAHSSERPVYYHNIPDLATDKLKAVWFEFEDPLLWYELPENSIIVVDEAQGWFGARDVRRAMPKHFSEFETHRHKGFDIHLITQHGSFVDAHVRRLTGRHIYYWRLWNGNRVSRYEFEKYSDVDKSSDLKMGRKSIIKLDKSFFGVYKSAVAHNMKFRPPPILFGLAALIVIIAVLSYVFYGRIQDKTHVNEAVSDSSKGVALTGSTAPGLVKSPLPGGRSFDTASYQPRVEGLPYSAPIYDALSTPTVAPKLTCFYSDDVAYNAAHSSRLNVLQGNGSSVACGCFTQQGTKVDVPFQICQGYALNGSFDNTPQGSSRSSTMGYRK